MAKGRRLLARLLGAGLLSLALEPFAAEAAPPDPTLKLFLSGFADMAAHSAADSMAKVTRFPLKNRVFQEAEKIDAAGFARHFTRNDFHEMAECLKSTPPRRAETPSADLGEWTVECDGNNFYFGRVNGGWRFTGFENVNE